MSKKKRAKKKEPERKALRVLIRGLPGEKSFYMNLPDWVPVFGVPYEVRIVDLPEDTMGVTTELKDRQIIRLNDTYQSLTAFWIAWRHEINEAAKIECHLKVNHNDLDRLAHVDAAADIALINAQ